MTITQTPAKRWPFARTWDLNGRSMAHAIDGENGGMIDPDKLAAVVVTVRTVLASVRTYDSGRNDAFWRGVADDPPPPSGDDYNAIIELLTPLYDLIDAIDGERVE